MATKLTKAVSRELVIFQDNRKEPREKDKWTVTMYENRIGFRQKRSRREVSIPIEVALGVALKLSDD